MLRELADYLTQSQTAVTQGGSVWEIRRLLYKDICVEQHSVTGPPPSEIAQFLKDRLPLATTLGSFSPTLPPVPVGEQLGWRAAWEAAFQIALKCSLASKAACLLLQCATCDVCRLLDDSTLFRLAFSATVALRSGPASLGYLQKLALKPDSPQHLNSAECKLPMDIIPACINHLGTVMPSAAAPTGTWAVWRSNCMLDQKLLAASAHGFPTAAPCPCQRRCCTCARRTAACPCVCDRGKQTKGRC